MSPPLSRTGRRYQAVDCFCTALSTFHTHTLSFPLLCDCTTPNPWRRTLAHQSATLCEPSAMKHQRRIRGIHRSFVSGSLVFRDPRLSPAGQSSVRLLCIWNRDPTALGHGPTKKKKNKLPRNVSLSLACLLAFLVASINEMFIEMRGDSAIPEYRSAPFFFPFPPLNFLLLTP